MPRDGLGDEGAEGEAGVSEEDIAAYVDSWYPPDVSLHITVRTLNLPPVLYRLANSVGLGMTYYGQNATEWGDSVALIAAMYARYIGLRQDLEESLRNGTHRFPDFVVPASVAPVQTAKAKRIGKAEKPSTYVSAKPGDAPLFGVTV
jgi:hypothetical protein